MAQKTASIYTAIPIWLYDLLLADADKGHRSLASQIALVLERQYRRKVAARKNGAAKP